MLDAFRSPDTKYYRQMQHTHATEGRQFGGNGHVEDIEPYYSKVTVVSFLHEY